MKFTVNQKELFAALQPLGKVVKNGPLPCTSYVLIEVDQGKATFTGTDIDQRASTIIGAEIEKPGKALVPWEKLCKLIKDFPEKVTISQAAGFKITVQTGTTRYTLNELDVDEFVPDTTINGDVYSISTDALSDALNKTEHAACRTNEGRFLLETVLFEANGNSINFVATDGRAVAYAQRKTDNTTGEFRIMVPIKYVDSLLAFIKDSETVDMIRNERTIKFNIKIKDNLIRVFSCKLVEGEYPNYQQVIPKTCEQTAVMKLEDLVRAVKRSITLCTEKQNHIRLEFEGQFLNIIVNTSEGNGVDPIAVTGMTKDFTISLCPTRVLTILQSLDCEYITMSLIDDLSPVVIRDDQETSMNILSPMRTA